MEILSKEFKASFSKYVESIIYDTLKKMLDRESDLPKFIKQANVSKYYDGVSPNTLKKYRQEDLKACRPITDGTVYYQKKELERFMLNSME